MYGGMAFDLMIEDLFIDNHSSFEVCPILLGLDSSKSCPKTPPFGK